jgi:hypothetical protein
VHERKALKETLVILLLGESRRKHTRRDIARKIELALELMIVRRSGDWLNGVVDHCRLQSVTGEQRSRAFAATHERHAASSHRADRGSGAPWVDAVTRHDRAVGATPRDEWGEAKAMTMHDVRAPSAPRATQGANKRDRTASRERRQINHLDVIDWLEPTSTDRDGDVETSLTERARNESHLLLRAAAPAVREHEQD